MNTDLSRMPKELQVVADTWLKRRMVQSSQLGDNDKLELVKGSKLQCRQVDIVGDHYLVTLERSLAGFDGGYIWSHHAGLPSATEGEIKEAIASGAKTIIQTSDHRAIQQHLIRIGLLDPPADGKWGSLSQSAFRALSRLAGDDTDEITEKKLQFLANFKSFKDLNFTPKNPSDPENILAVKAIKRMVALGMHVTISMGSTSPAYNLFYISGINPDGTLNSNKLDGWNDLRFLVEISQSGVVILHGCWLATVDAGLYWRGSRRMNKDGALQVDEDAQFLSLSAVGRHGRTQYPALVQVGGLTATRDRTGDGRTSDDLKVKGDWFGSNDHHGWDSEIVGINSAGCCVGKTISGHEKMMELIKRDRRYLCNNGYAWTRTILKGKNL